jgi:hypothetical protein
MSCRSCGVESQTKLNVEIMIHLPAPMNQDKPGVLVSPKLLVCLDCGLTEFSIPKTDLRLLGAGVAP